MATFINEFPHPDVQIHYHPHGADNFKLAFVDEALQLGTTSFELDLHLLNSTVRVNHDAPTTANPTFSAVLQRILSFMGNASTVHNDGKQFLIWVEPKQKNNALFRAIFNDLAILEPGLSTQVTAQQSGLQNARGITVLFTGAPDKRKAMRNLLFSEFGEDCFKRLIFETERYDLTSEHTISNLSEHQEPFEWKNYKYPHFSGHINRDHQDRFNMRVWGSGPSLKKIRMTLSAGADGINVNRGLLDDYVRLLKNQVPAGHYPSLSIREHDVAISWRANLGSNLSTLVGSYDDNTRRLNFKRRICLTDFLKERPHAQEPTVMVHQKGVQYVYRDASEQRIWTTIGQFESTAKRPIFNGSESRLLDADEEHVLGFTPFATNVPDGRVFICYRQGDNHHIWYVVGNIENNRVNGREFRLTLPNNDRRGFHPTAAFGSDQIVILYEGSHSQKLWYVIGTLDSQGQVDGKEHCLTTSSGNFRGSNPCIASRPDRLVALVYQGLDQDSLFYSVGEFDSQGRFLGSELSLTAMYGAWGKYPTVSFAGNGDIVILYQDADDKNFYYIAGPVDLQTGHIDGTAKRVTASL